MKLMPMPSPRGTNFERLFVVKLPRRSPLGAYDAAPEPSLRMKLEELLAENLSGHAYERALEQLELHLGGNEYDRAHEAQDEDREESPGQARIRRFLEDEGLATDDIEEFFELLRALPKKAKPKNMRERREARERQEADDETEFEQEFPQIAATRPSGLEGGLEGQVERELREWREAEDRRRAHRDRRMG